MTDEKVERVARALFEIDAVYKGRRWAEVSERVKEMFRSDARVAIRAMG